MATPTALLVGVDSSPESLVALDLALELAGCLGAKVIAVHAVGLLEEGGYRPRPDLAAIVEAARARASVPDVTVDSIEEDGVPTDVVLRVRARARTSSSSAAAGSAGPSASSARRARRS